MQQLQSSSAAYGDMGDDQRMALTRKLVSGETDDEAVVEDNLNLAQQIAAEADQLRVDAEREPPIAVRTPVVVLRSGEEEQLVELVPCSSHHGQGHEQTLFSWAELPTKQVGEPKRRGRDPRPSEPSLFDWALEREQEAGLAAAGG